MSHPRFYFQLILISVGVAIGIIFFHQLPRFQSYEDLSWIGLAFFILLSIAMFYAGRSAARSTNKHNFTNAVLGFTIGKMMLAILIILAYLQLAEPDNRLFILPFFGIYFIYTIFETYFMTRLGKMNA